MLQRLRVLCARAGGVLKRSKSFEQISASLPFFQCGGFMATKPNVVVYRKTCVCKGPFIKARNKKMKCLTDRLGFRLGLVQKLCRTRVTGVGEPSECDAGPK